MNKNPNSKKTIQNLLKMLKKEFIGIFLLISGISHKMLNVSDVRKLVIMIMLVLINSRVTIVFHHNITPKSVLKKLFVSGVINQVIWLMNAPTSKMDLFVTIVKENISKSVDFY